MISAFIMKRIVKCVFIIIYLYVVIISSIREEIMITMLRFIKFKMNDL